MRVVIKTGFTVYIHALSAFAMSIELMDLIEYI